MTDSNGKGRAGRGVDTAIDSITDLLALEHESERLRLALEERERALESIAEECRRLEDQLEDRHLDNDKLKQRLTQRRQALNDSQEQIKRLEGELELLRGGQMSGWLVARPITDEVGGGASRSSPRAARKAPIVIVLLAALLVGLGLFVWSQHDDHAPAVEIGAESAATTGQAAEDAPGDSSVAPVTATTATDASTMVLGTVQDPLRGGGSGPLMVALRGGRFVMGRDTLDPDDANPAHTVDVAPFLIGAHEITFEDYDRFALATGRSLPRDFGWGRGRRPVVDVSWSDAIAYARWLSAETARRYRLPSEAEWELAAGGGQESAYWWGSYPESGRAVCFNCGTRWDNRSTAPVATFGANPFGLYDTAGNAAEWVADCYLSGYDQAPRDGQAWDSAGCEARVVRGGSFARPARSMRHFARGRLPPDTRLDGTGFRVARDP